MITGFTCNDLELINTIFHGISIINLQQFLEASFIRMTFAFCANQVKAHVSDLTFKLLDTMFNRLFMFSVFSEKHANKFSDHNIVQFQWIKVFSQCIVQLLPPKQMQTCHFFVKMCEIIENSINTVMQSSYFRPILLTHH